MGSNDWFEIIRELFYNGNSPLIRIDHNRDATIENVNINFDLNPVKICVPDSKGYRDRFQEMISDKILLNSVIDKQIYLVNELEKFKNIVYKENIQPTIRMKALFSPFSTIRQESDTDDLSKLELEEKRILLDLAKRGCLFKLIMNMDFTRAIVCGYGIEEISQRVGDLCKICDELKDNSNFQAVICPDTCNYEPIWTFDEVCIEKQMMFHGKNNYRACYWSSDINEIKYFNMEFDKEFVAYTQRMYLIWRVLHIDSLSKYILYCLNKWIRYNISI